MEESPVCEAYGASEAVFVGKVVQGKSLHLLSEAVASNRRDLTFKFVVSRGFSGAKTGEVVEINTGLGFGDCGFPFETDAEYIVYAYRHDGKLRTNICTRTKLLARAEDDLKHLPALLRTSGSRITGTVERYGRSSLLGKSHEPVSGLTVRLKRANDEGFMKTRTDSEGRYTFNNVPLGRYRMGADVETGWELAYSDEKEFFINDRGCASNNLTVRNDSEVVVTVLDPEGSPVQSIWVEFIPVGVTSKKDLFTNSDLTHPEEFSVTNPQGKLYMFDLPPGRYTVSVNFMPPPGYSSPFPPTFAPGVTDRKSARIIEIKPGTEINDIVIKIPKRIAVK